MNEPGFTQMIDLAAERLGGKALACTDDFFAEKENLLKPGRGIFIPDKYTDRGKWMDGWESRRKRSEGHDWCIVQLATSGKIYGVVLLRSIVPVMQIAGMRCLPMLS